MELIKIRNTGGKPLVLRHDGKGDVSIATGAERILQAEYAFIHFGHPASHNEGRDKGRDTEYTNARTLWGFYAGLMAEAEWEADYKPAFECYDLDDNRVFMVLDDPDGSLAAAHAGTVPEGASNHLERSGIEAQVAALQSQVEQLTNLLLVQRNVPEAVVDPDGHDGGDDGQDHDGNDSDSDEDNEPTTGTDVDKDPDNSAQAKRNAKRDLIPKPSADEAPVVPDKPRTTRVGRR